MKAEVNDLKEILDNRGSIYGDFKTNISMLVYFKKCFKIISPIYNNDSCAEFIHNILCLKLARIVASGYDFEGESKDSFMDFVNYIYLFNTLKRPYKSILKVGDSDKKFLLEDYVKLNSNPYDITTEMIKDFCSYVERCFYEDKDK